MEARLTGQALPLSVMISRSFAFCCRFDYGRLLPLKEAARLFGSRASNGPMLLRTWPPRPFWVEVLRRRRALHLVRSRRRALHLENGLCPTDAWMLCPISLRFFFLPLYCLSPPHVFP